ncbi:hypothetical protein ACFQH6_07125 [Halobacteriaceae archaeon GCM10025711]
MSRPVPSPGRGGRVADGRTASRIARLLAVCLLAVVASGAAAGSDSAPPSLAGDAPVEQVDCERAAFDVWIADHGFASAWVSTDGRVSALPNPGGFAQYLSALQTCVPAETDLDASA